MRSATRLVRIAVAITTTVCLLVIPVAPANAVACGTSPDYQHCYAIAYWHVTSPSGFTGDQANLRSNCMTVPSGSALSHEMWISNSGGWLEVGLYVGSYYLLTNHGNTPYTFAWEHDPDGSEYGYVGVPYTLGTAVAADIHSNAADPSNWRLVIPGWNLLVYGAIVAPADTIHSGTEAVTNTAHDYGSSSALQWRSNTFTWVSGWSSASGHANDPIGGNPPATGTWISNYDWARTQIGAAC